MTVTFIGHGYVGLVTAAVFADLGNKVWVIGHTADKVANLKKGIIPIYEPGLDEVVKRNVDAGRLLFTLDYTPAVPESDVVFIAVGTPPKENGEADLSVVYDVAKKASRVLDGYTVMITKSTVPVGTNVKLKEIIASQKPQKTVCDYASIPEFLREGQALNDTFYPDRVVIGTETKKAEAMLVELHNPIIENEKNNTKLVLTNIPTAEMIKYASNAFLATKISFANAIARLSEESGADGIAVLEGVGLDKRIGSSFLQPGAGYGGSCFPKDVKALIVIAKQYGYDFSLLKDVEDVNHEAMLSIVEKAREMLGGSIDGKRIGVLGLSFKPDTDDMRDAPSITIINKLLSDGAQIYAFDPIAVSGAKRIFKDAENLTYAKDEYEAAEGAELMIVLTEWNEFREIDLKKVKQLMKTPNLLDGRNIYDPDKTREMGFVYKGVGR